MSILIGVRHNGIIKEEQSLHNKRNEVIMMIELGVDEITLVLQLPKELMGIYNPYNWDKIADNMITHFEDKAEFEKIFGEKRGEARTPAGYTNAYTYGDHSFYFAVAFHQYQLRMGVVVKFSAQALDYYCEKSGENVYVFLQKIKDDGWYTIRLSRVDVVADYIDENVDITDIYQSLMDNRVGIFREYLSEKDNRTMYKRCNIKYSGFIKQREVPTVYIGSVQSNARLKIYDKKREQIERNGTKLDKARNVTDWTRMEASLKNEYAHQMTDELLKTQSDDEYANLIACVMLQKFRFMYIQEGVADCETEYTQGLMDCISNQNFVLKAPSSRNHELAKSIRYIFFGSGIMTTIYKIREIWGEKAVSILLVFIEDCIKEWQPNDECRYWLKCHRQDYQDDTKDFERYLNENVSIYF